MFRVLGFSTPKTGRSPELGHGFLLVAFAVAWRRLRSLSVLSV